MGRGEAGPLVSVVIPTFNREKFLRSCIDSVLSQAYSPLEVVVVDDGSTDGTPELCATYGERIRYFRKQNGGAASALNFGIQRIEGSWFKWLSSDDELEQDALGELVQEGERTGAGVVYGDFSKIDARGKKIGTHRDRAYPSTGDFVVMLWWHLVGSAGAAIIRKSCLDEVGGFDESLRYAEDYDWWLRAAMIHGVRFRYVPRLVARYRIHPGQVTAQKLKETALLRARIKARVSGELSGMSSTDPLLGRYRGMTRSYRRSLAPLVAARNLLTRVPGSTKVRYWTGRLLPKCSSMVHWAADPPVTP
jgi:glycosyltransferase involved in cell wall biosynthesis